MGFSDLHEYPGYESSACSVCNRDASNPHGIECTDSDHFLYPTLKEIKETSTINQDLLIILTDSTIVFIATKINKYFLEALKSPAWNNLTKEKLNDRSIQINNFSIDSFDTKDWADIYCVDWFYKTFGFKNVIFVNLKYPSLLNHPKSFDNRQTAKEKFKQLEDKYSKL